MSDKMTVGYVAQLTPQGPMANPMGGQAALDAARAPFIELEKLRAEVTELRKDAERLDWMERAINNKGSVWILPCGESLRFVQVRHCGYCHNYPAVEGFRAAIDAAMLAAPAVGAA